MNFINTDQPITDIKKDKLGFELALSPKLSFERGEVRVRRILK